MNVKKISLSLVAVSGLMFSSSVFSMYYMYKLKSLMSYAFSDLAPHFSASDVRRCFERDQYPRLPDLLCIFDFHARYPNYLEGEGQDSIRDQIHVFDNPMYREFVFYRFVKALGVFGEDEKCRLFAKYFQASVYEKLSDEERNNLFYLGFLKNGVREFQKISGEDFEKLSDEEKRELFGEEYGRGNNRLTAEDFTRLSDALSLLPRPESVNDHCAFCQKEDVNRSLYFCPLSLGLSYYCDKGCFNNSWADRKQDYLDSLQEPIGARSVEESENKTEIDKSEGKKNETKEKSKVKGKEEKVNSKKKHKAKKKKGESRKKVDNVDYIQLDTVNQFNPDIVVDVQKKRNSFGRNEGEKRRKYDPSGVCGSLAAASAYWLCKFFGENNNEKYIGIINREAVAKKYLKDLLEKGLKTSWLDREEIKNIIQRYKFPENRVTIIGSLGALDVGEFNQIADNFKKPDDYYHVFILNTAVFEPDEEVPDVIREFAEKLRGKVDQTALNGFVAGERSKLHWYTVGVSKEGETIKYYIVDTGGFNRIGNQNNFEREQFFCDWLLGKESDIDLKSQERFRIGHSALRSGVIKKNTSDESDDEEPEDKRNDYSTQDSDDEWDAMSMRQEDTQMSKSLARSIRQSCPEAVKNVIRRYKRAMEAIKKNPEKAKKHLSAYFRRCPKLVILYGPNGTGKTEIARFIAKEIGRELYFLNAGFLGTTYQNSESENLRKQVYLLVEKSKQHLCELVLDEVDALSKRENGHNSKDSGSLAGALAGLLDICSKHNIFVVATTNFPEEIGPKVRTRAEVIRVDLPDWTERRRLIEYFLLDNVGNMKLIHGKRLTYESLDLNWLTRCTSGFNIRGISRLVDEAVSRAEDRAEDGGTNNNEILVIQEDFDNVLNRNNNLDEPSRWEKMRKIAKNAAKDVLVGGAKEAAKELVVVAIKSYTGVAARNARKYIENKKIEKYNNI